MTDGPRHLGKTGVEIAVLLAVLAALAVGAVAAWLELFR